jgi:hypothetical protein
MALLQSCVLRTVFRMLAATPGAYACLAASSATVRQTPVQSTQVPARRVFDEKTRWQTAIYTRRREAIRDSSRWRALWADMRRNFYPPGQLPVVDFSREMVIFAAMGGRPTMGYAVIIHEVLQRADTLFVVLRETCPKPDALVSQTGSAPVDAVAVRSTDAVIVFVEPPESC